MSNWTLCTDHQGIFPPYYASEESDTLDGIVRGEEAEIKRKLTVPKPKDNL